ncbi:uncharacterized protein METZ01_LOCUS430711, partial [marine metagenome]
MAKQNHIIPVRPKEKIEITVES